MGAAAHCEAEKDFIQLRCGGPQGRECIVDANTRRLYKGALLGTFFSLPKILLSPRPFKAPGGRFIASKMLWGVRAGTYRDIPGWRFSDSLQMSLYVISAA